ncbi:response regulator transcription factor [Streptomyces sp. NPDC048337]|uniref:response regulator transcription factor n=1 Tax=Streptomyces sp. NPDC048337 TaxID=3365535 RepID=UPI0037137EA9
MARFSLSDYRQLWAVASRAITCEQSEFPGTLADADLAGLFQADAVDSCLIDLRTGQSRQVGGHPAELVALCVEVPSEFHAFLSGHPAVRYYQRGGDEPAVNSSELTSRREWRGSPSFAYLREHGGMGEQLVIRVTGSPGLVCGIAVMRAVTPFTDLDLGMAKELGTVLSGLHLLRRPPHLSAESGAGTRLTPRETQVLILWQDGLTGGAIARRLGITARTVDKHAENLRRKLGTPDRTSAVVRAQSLGLLTVPHGLRPEGLSEQDGRD